MAKAMMEYSEKGIEHTKFYEGLRLKAYQDPGGVWTIGYGHTGKEIYPEMEITEAEAHKLLREDIKSAEEWVGRLVKVEVTQGQFDALVDFTFNAGPGALRDSTLLRLVNAGLMNRAAEEFEKWIYAKGEVLKGLIKRRESTKEMFLA